MAFSSILNCGPRLSLAEVPLFVDSEEDSSGSAYEHRVTTTTENLKDIATWYTGSADNWEVLAVYNGKHSSKGIDAASKPPASLKKGEVIFIPSEMLIRTDKLQSWKSRAKREDPKPTGITSLETVIVFPEEDSSMSGMDLDELSIIVEEDRGEESGSGVPLAPGAVSEDDVLDQAGPNSPTTIPDSEPSTGLPSDLNPPDTAKESERMRLLRELLLQ